MESSSYAITADIGGTNFKLRLSKYQPEEKSFSQVDFRVLKSHKQTLFSEVLLHYTSQFQLSPHSISHIALGVPGMIKDGRCLEWDCQSAQDLQSAFPRAKVTLLNDIVAMSQSLRFFQQCQGQLQFHCLQGAPSTASPGTNLVMSIGTGFGIAYLYQAMGKVFVKPSEGWRSFSTVDPTDEVQVKLGHFIFHKLKKPSSLVKVLKGAGILSLYQFAEEHLYPQLKNSYLGQTKKRLKKEQKRRLCKQEVVTYGAVMKEDELCGKTIELFVRVMAAVCQHLMLVGGAYQGVFLTGGAVNYLSDFIMEKREIFLEEFCKHEERSEMLKRVPVVVFRQNPTLIGLQEMVLQEQL